MRFTLLLCAVAAVTWVYVADARGETFDLSIGVATLGIDGDSARNLDGASGLSLQGSYLWDEFRLSGLKMGIGLHIGLWAEEWVEVAGTNVDFVSQDFFLFLPEFRIAYEIPIGKSWYIEPRVGVGVAMAYYSADGSDLPGGGVVEDSGWKLAPSLRPGLQVGYTSGGFSTGLEADYLLTRLDFDNEVGGAVTELYLGFFARVRF